MTREPSSLRLLLASLKDLEAGLPAEPARRQRALNLAGIHLRAAEARLHDRRSLALPVSEEEVAEVAKAREWLRRLQLPDAPKPRWDPAALDAVRRYVGDSLAPAPMAAEPAAAAEQALSQFGPVLLQGAGEAGGGMLACFVLAADLLQLRQAWNTAAGRAVFETLRGQIATSGRTAAALAPLAVAAAVVDDSDAPAPLFRAALEPGLLASASDTERWGCVAALARLSRQPDGRVRPAVAAGCLHLLGTRDGWHPRELAALLPAALGAPYSDSGALLHRLAATLFDAEAATADWRAELDDGAIIRNTAVVLHASRFEPLQQHLSTLLERAYGRAFIAALISRRHGGVALRDQNGEHAFVVKAGATLAERLGANVQDVALQLNRRDSEQLSAILTELSWPQQDFADGADDERAALPAGNLAAAVGQSAGGGGGNVVQFPTFTGGLQQKALRQRLRA